MSDISLNLEGVSPEVASVLQSDAAKAIIAAAIETAKAPLVTKRDELLASLMEKGNKLKSFEDAATQAEAARKQAELLAAEKDGSVESVKTHFSGLLSAKEQELNDLRASILNEKVSNKLNAAIREVKGVPELLEPHLRGRIKADLVEGKVKISVLTANGMPMLNTDGKDATLVDLLNEFKGNAIFGRAFEAPAAGGTGGRPSGQQTANNPWAPATKNVTAQMVLYRTDKAAAIRMAAEHGVKLD